MNPSYHELIDRIRGEVPDLERVAQRALRAWAQGQLTTNEKDIYIDSVALNLQSFYAGIERLFELIARQIDSTLPNGETWHRDLLKQMTKDLQGSRPAVIGQETFFALDNFRRFRHLLHNVYTMNLVPDKMAGLISALPGLWAKLQAELLAFADFLEAMDQATQD